ncbi:MAG TPA: histidine kinase N-terminal domain-containing protein [Actinocrinis sp.]|nr:histidine kinase N-terminal domain-containing protein [Actinocrinis sp.]
MNDLVRDHTALDPADLDWLHLIVADWQMVADLSFADLVLWVPTADETRYVAVAQMRPNTGPTSYPDDLVGHVVPRGKRPLLDQALDEGRIIRDGDPEWREAVPVRVESIPVRRAGRVIAVIARNTNLLTARTPSRLELTYLQTASDLAQMIASGRFPHHNARSGLDAMPRVGDGMMRLDADGVVTYASPNAVSGFHRLGLAADLIGAHLGRLCADLASPARQDGPTDEAIASTASGREPRDTEFESNGATMRLRAIPLNPQGERIGALVLVRDVTELRRRDRELVTKDATIREIHHRVKNNLQTVAALLRLQARRLDEPGGKAALHEAVRRVGSIAIVHETLSQTLDERVEFDEIADRVLAMVVDFSMAGSGSGSGGAGAGPSANTAANTGAKESADSGAAADPGAEAAAMAGAAAGPGEASDAESRAAGAEGGDDSDRNKAENDASDAPDGAGADAGGEGAGHRAPGPGGATGANGGVNGAGGGIGAGPGAGSAGREISARRVGSFGELAAQIATPLAMVLTELLQNAFEHGLTGAGSSLEVTAVREDGRLRILVVDDGHGLPAGFDPQSAGNLGLQIVRAMVQGDLGGDFDMADRDGGGTVVTVSVPVRG